MAKKTISNKIYIYTKDFGSLEAESLKIDYLRFNLKSSLRDSEISTLATYFRRSGFSSYKKERDKSQKRTSIFDDKYFEVTFVLYTPYHDGTHLEFAGESANQLYSLIKSNKFNTNLLKKYGAGLVFFGACAQTQIVRPHLLSTHGNIYHYFCVPRLLVRHSYSFYIQGYYSEKPFSSPLT